MSKNNGIGRKNYWKMNGKEGNISLSFQTFLVYHIINHIQEQNVIEVVIPTRFEPATPTLSKKVPKLDVFQNI
jgi:hypothetical protein